MLKQPALNTNTHQTGLTLVELMITLAVLAVLTAIALPSFNSLFERWRTGQAVSALESTLAFARSEAVRRGGGISIVQNSCSDDSADTAWQCGWSVVLDSNADGTSDTESTPLQVVPAIPQIKILASENAAYITLDRWGTMQLLGESTSFHLSIHPESRSESHGNKLCIRPGGHTQQIKGSSSCTA